jgi:hypothetical protein
MERCNVNMLTNIRFLPTEGNFNNVHRKSLKLATVWDYNRHVGKWTNLMAWPLIWWRKKIHFWFLDFTIHSHFIILASCSSTLCHWLFRMTMVRALIEENERVPWIQTTRQERQTPSTSQVKTLYTRSMLAFEGKRIWHCASYSKTNKQAQNSRVQNAN